MLIIVLVTTGFSYYPGLFAKFELQDDHYRIRLASNGPVHDQVPEGETLITALTGRGEYPGRFVPFNYCITYFCAYVCGFNPFLWHVFPLAYALLTVIFLYLAASRFFESFWIGGLLAVWILQLPDIRVWAYIARGEHIGMVFLSACLFCIVYAGKKPQIGRWDWAGLACFAGASMCKESFILVAPALLYIIWYLKGKSSSFSNSTSFRYLLPIILSYTICFIFMLSLVLLSLILTKGTVLGSQFFVKNTNSVDFFHQLNVFRNIPRLSLWFIPVIGFAVWYIKNKSHKNMYAYYHIAIFISLWATPQIVLYGARGAFRGRYWLPLMIGFCLINAIALNKLMKEKSARNICLIVLTLVTLWTARNIQVNWSQSVSFKNRTHAFENMIRDVVSHVPDNGNIVVVADPVDPANSVVHRLGMFGRPHVNAYLFQPGIGIKDRFCYVGKSVSNVLTPEEIDAVIYFKPSYRDIVQRQRWYNRERFSLHKSIEKEIYLSLRKLSLVSFDYGYEYDLSISSR